MLADYDLRRAAAFATMTRSVAKTTSRRNLSGAAESGHDADVRVSSPLRDRAASSSRASAHLRQPRSDDGAHRAGLLGRSAAARGADSRAHAACDHDAWRGLDAHALFQAAAAEARALPGRQRLAAAARADPARLFVPESAAAVEERSPSHRRDPRSTARAAGRAAAVAASGRAARSAGGRDALERSRRCAVAGRALRTRRREQAYNRAPLPLRDPHVPRPVAPAVA